MGLVRTLHDYGMYDSNSVKFRDKDNQPLEFMKHYLLKVPEGDQTELWGYSVQVEIIGWLKNNRVMYRFATSHPPMKNWGEQRAYSKNVGIPLSIGAQMLANGKAKKKGVDGLETMLPAQEFVAKMRKRDFVINESLVYL